MALTQVQPGMLGTPQPYNFKNRIINGAMVIDQRNAGASVTPVGGNYTLDRWQCALSQLGKYTVQQNAGSVTTPNGFTNYLGVTSSSAYSIGSGDYFFLDQIIEGYNVADLGWGTANAKTVTLSFQVYSSLTGTFGGSIQNTAQTRSYPFSYSISIANTWTTISVTIAGDTTGSWPTNNTGSIKLIFGFGVGSTYSGTAGSWAGANYFSATGATSVVGTNGATFYITGVQLEVGNNATGFDYRPYGTELALCQRYCIKVGGDTGNNSYAAFGMGGNTTTALLFYYPPTTFRSTPTLSSYSSLVIDDTNGAISISALALDTNGSSPAFIRLNATATGLSQFRPYFLRGSSSSGNLILSAEL